MTRTRNIEVGLLSIGDVIGAVREFRTFAEEELGLDLVLGLARCRVVKRHFEIEKEVRVGTA